MRDLSQPPSVIPFGLVPTDMKAMFHNAAFLAAGVPVFDIADKFGDTDMLVCDCVKGEALAEVLKDKDVALMRAHGSVACGPTLQTAVFRAVYTEVNARIQHFAQALSSDGNLVALTKTEGQLADVPNQTAGMRAWHLWRARCAIRIVSSQIPFVAGCQTESVHSSDFEALLASERQRERERLPLDEVAPDKDG